MSHAIYRRKHLKLSVHVSRHLIKMLSGKLTRNEVMKDSVEIEALNETLASPDTPNTNKESQLARLYYKNGKTIF